MNKFNEFGILTLLILPALCLFLSSCTLFEDNSEQVIPGETGTYAGTYTQGIEDSDFNPCIVEDENWTIIEIQDTASFFSGMREAKGNPVFMKLKGIPSELGEYRGGHLTIYDREFQVEKAVAVRNLDNENCETTQLLNQ